MPGQSRPKKQQRFTAILAQRLGIGKRYNVGAGRPALTPGGRRAATPGDVTPLPPPGPGSGRARLPHALRNASWPDGRWLRMVPLEDGPPDAATVAFIARLLAPEADCGAACKAFGAALLLTAAEVDRARARQPRGVYGRLTLGAQGALALTLSSLTPRTREGALAQEGRNGRYLRAAAGRLIARATGRRWRWKPLALAILTYWAATARARRRRN
jgi:hypothetical protein